MSVAAIALYCWRAARFAFLAASLWGAWYAWRLHRSGGRFVPQRFWGQLLLVFYLAALVEITALRGCATLGNFWALPHSLATVQPVLLATTLAQWRAGAWPFVYHVVGNLLWFVPLGVLAPALWLPMRRPWAVLACGGALSLGIEAAQWLLATGQTDVDDLLLNTLGALLGWLCWRLWQAAHRARTP